jgi:drug/metabolite transporter (DMT)-like permease
MRLTLGKTSAVLMMVLVTFLWSTAGVITRQLHFAHSFEVTFWRAASCAVALALALSVQQGRSVWRNLRHSGGLFWASAGCWAVMFTAFMIALTMASVANVLITMACGPLLTALIARLALGHRIPARTWLAIIAAGLGIGAMFASEALHANANPGAIWGTLVALCVPVAAAINWNIGQYGHEHGHDIDLVPAVMVGASLSAAVTLPLAWPLGADLHDASLLMGLGLFQLALPCALCVACSRVLKAPQMSLLQLQEVLFGIVLAWLGANEQPAASVFVGGTLVLGALLTNEWLGLRERRQ